MRRLPVVALGVLKGRLHSSFRILRASGFGVDPRPAPGTLASMLFICQHGFESLLERELTEAGLTMVETGRGWARAEPLVGDAIKLSLAQLAFPQLVMTAIRELRGESVNSLAQKMAD